MKAIYKLSAHLFLFFSLCYSITASAQTTHKVAGSVVDSLSIAIADANILLIAGSDTLKTVTDKSGKFSFKGIKAENFSLSISSMGYYPNVGNYKFDKGEKQLQMAPIVLKNSGIMLKEVVVHAPVKPMRVMKDTVEFNAAAFQVLAGDKVSDLIKQMSGIDVDFEDNVTTMGKGMTKLRVNGKDFFTNNVKDFISKLPASIVAKIQVIDDYGDDANFTGIKVGEPQKMLNIVTKSDINKGVFGNIGINGGTSKQVSLNGNANIWREREQIGTNLNATQANNGAGQSRNSGASVNLRRTFKKNGSFGINYSFYSNFNDSENISFIESVNTLGTIYSANENRGNSKGFNHNLGLDFQNNTKKDFLNASMGIGYSQNTGNNSSSSKQEGIIKQDLTNQSNSRNTAPSVNGNLNWSRRLAKKGASISANMNLRASLGKNGQNIISNTLYYDPITDFLVKDSLLNRRVNTNYNNNNFGGTLTYSHPLKKPKDTLASRNINASYGFSIGNTNNDILTYVTDKANNIRYVDSLSTQYSSLFFSQNIGLSYAYNSKKMNYTLGASVRPNTLIGDYENLNVHLKNTNINYAPTFNLSYRVKENKTLSMRYNGNSNSPSPSQLQPVRNTQNLQNVIVGNPDLKPSFNHNFNISYNGNDAKSGKSLQLSIGVSTTQNQIVSNVILIRDTLNGLKQETHYENANGMYNLNGNYFYNIPLAKNKFTISIRGNFNYGNNIVFTDNVKLFNKAFSFSQSLNSTLMLKKIAIGGSAAYSLSANNYTLIKGVSRNVETWNFVLTARGNFLKSYKFETNFSKRINTGYAIVNTNPFLIGASLSRTFLKSKVLIANVKVADLLNQGNNLSRYVSGNSTIDSRSNQITRYFTFGLSYNLQKFGGSRGMVTYY
ncbi:outer membrane beta-barrel protein [Pedobacter sp. Hv1]|uniref:outer membrane beta-barrel protein n=1 Tax=Pedobacter sp. Hv1 TaxID=1740090 RepID=UPI0006D8B6DC|nr:outer membrane beta-barrel protein [Pedobacter sp. Hv1]KQB99183.1 hypothetical protein AQF98_16515 [Pedobacter sp. Hv1]